jgi:hypothetical protein
VGDFAELKAREAAEAERLSATAEAAAKGAISRTTIAASQGAIHAAAGDIDLRRLRTDLFLMTALESDLRVAKAQAFLLILDALLVGYRTEAEGQGDGFEGARVTVTITGDARDALASTPIVGGSSPPKAYTASEIAGALARRLEGDINGTLAAPLAGKADPAAIPAALAAVAAEHAGRVGDAVGEAYFAGVAAGFKALSQALVS